MNRIVKTVFSGLVAAVTIVLGYFVFEIFYEGFPAAVLEILPNVVQVTSGIIISTILYPLLSSIPSFRQMSKNQ